MSLTVTDLCKRFGRRWALRDVNFQCDEGLLGLVGPNGAGKTTLMRILATLLPPSNGATSWRGVDLHRNGPAIRDVLGYLPQSLGVYGELSARAFLPHRQRR